MLVCLGFSMPAGQSGSTHFSVSDGHAIIAAEEVQPWVRTHDISVYLLHHLSILQPFRMFKELHMWRLIWLSQLYIKRQPAELLSLVPL